MTPFTHPFPIDCTNGPVLVHLHLMYCLLVKLSLRNTAWRCIAIGLQNTALHRLKHTTASKIGVTYDVVAAMGARKTVRAKMKYVGVAVRRGYDVMVRNITIIL